MNNEHQDVLDLIADLEKQGAAFTSTPHYDADGDCIHYFFRDCACNATRIDDILTLFYSKSDGELVGIQLKGFRMLARLVDKMSHGDHRNVSIDSVLECIYTMREISRSRREQIDAMRKQHRNRLSAFIPEEAFS